MGTKVKETAFYKKLKDATKEVEQVHGYYRDEIERCFKRYKLYDERESLEGPNVNLLTIDTSKAAYGKTDGIYPCEYLKQEKDKTPSYVPFFLLMELKLDEDFNDNNIKAHVLTQVVAYLGQLHYLLQQGTEGQYRKALETFKGAKELVLKLDTMPSTVIVGSKKNCFAVATQELKHHYIGLDIMAIKTASKFYETPQGSLVYQNILEDSKLDYVSPVFETSDSYCMMDVVEIVYRINQNIKSADDLSPRNLYRAFTRFTSRVLTPETVEKLSNRQQASLLAQFIVNRKAIKLETDLDGSIQGLKVNGLSIQVDTKEWNTFSWIYNLKQYTEDEQKKVTAITDQLISEDDRRRKGDYYTPAIWAEEAHKLLDRNLEPDWRDTYMVWDCAWGTGNLTRDCTRINGNYISDLYCSTLHTTDLEIAERYNRKATKFQYDFLNDDVEEMEQIKLLMEQSARLISTSPAMAQALMNQANNLLYNTKLYKNAPTLINGLLGCDLEKYIKTGERVSYPKKKLLFLINPPYKTSKNNVIGNENTSSTGVAKNKVNDIAVEDGMGLACRQLYALFMYRIMSLKVLFSADVKIGAFTQSDFLSTVAYDKFRDKLYNMAEFKEGFMLRGDNFQGVSKDIGISFTLFDINSNKTKETTLSILEVQHGEIVEICKHNVHAAEKLFNKTIRANIPTKFNDKKQMVPMKSALNIREDAEIKTVPTNCIGGFQCNGNAINYNDQYVAMYSSPFHGAANMNVLETTALDVMVLFTARRTISGSHKTWYNWKDEYENPNKDHPKYKQFEADAIAYSLFESKSQQSSLRNIEFNGEQWNVENQFFWMSVKDIGQLAAGKLNPEDTNDYIRDDLEEFGTERFVYKKLKEVTLSPDAREVLNRASDIVRKSFKYRMSFSKTPEGSKYQINTWDAGWYQIKGLCKNIPELKADMDDFSKSYKKFEERMRKLVYELGFLYK